MSSFLPEANTADQQAFQSSSISSPNPILKKMFDIDPIVLEQIAQWLEQRGLSIPITQTTGAAAALNSTSGTTFPVSPADGQEFLYVADGTAGVYWAFRYRTTTGKWIFTGGAPLFSQITTEETLTSTTYTALATAGPSIVLPFAADYDVEIGAAGRINTAADQFYMSFDIGGTGAVDGDAWATTSNTSGTAPVMTGSRRLRKTGLTAVTLTAKYRVSADTGRFANRWMAVWPVQM